MRRKIQNETRKLKSSSSQEKTSNISTKYSEWQQDHRLFPKPSKRQDLISKKEADDSVNPCIFQYEANPFQKRVSCGIQTDPNPCFIESLIQENQNLFSELTDLKQEMQSLTSIVKDLTNYKNIAKLKANQVIIEMLQNENKAIKRLIDS